jgi:hypothetical protein
MDTIAYLTIIIILLIFIIFFPGVFNDYILLLIPTFIAYLAYINTVPKTITDKLNVSASTYFGGMDESFVLDLQKELIDVFNNNLDKPLADNAITTRNTFNLNFDSVWLILFNKKWADARKNINSKINESNNKKIAASFCKDHNLNSMEPIPKNKSKEYYNYEKAYDKSTLDKQINTESDFLNKLQDENFIIEISNMVGWNDKQKELAKIISTIVPEARKQYHKLEEVKEENGQIILENIINNYNKVINGSKFIVIFSAYNKENVASGETSEFDGLVFVKDPIDNQLVLIAMLELKNLASIWKDYPKKVKGLSQILLLGKIMQKMPDNSFVEQTFKHVGDIIPVIYIATGYAMPPQSQIINKLLGETMTIDDLIKYKTATGFNVVISDDIKIKVASELSKLSIDNIKSKTPQYPIHRFIYKKES